MQDIAANIRTLRSHLPASVKLVAVSKMKPVSDILVAYNAGQKVFGENRVQELLSKKDLLPPDIEWHLIGHLQTNKVKFIVPFVRMIHSVDTFRLLKTIDNEAKKTGRILDCLLQFHIASEETKFGFDLQEAEQMLSSEDFRQVSHARICGVMGMATFTENEDQVRNEFRNLAEYFNRLSNNYFRGSGWFREISMGMSGDYRIAVEEGSTMVRIGSIIFGERR